MGNQLTQPGRPAAAIDLVSDVPHVVFKEALGVCMRDESCGEGGGAAVLCVSGHGVQGGCRSCSHLTTPTWHPPTHTTHHAPGGGRLLKSMVCIHDEAGLVVVKVQKMRENGRA